MFARELLSVSQNLVFQPFLRFWSVPLAPRGGVRRTAVSTLLEILGTRFQRLGAMWDAVERAVSTLLEILGMLRNPREAVIEFRRMFQPFLRFWAPPPSARLSMLRRAVSTLLEILET